ncbi:LOW QUALITY PROTEIN: olfactory receptor 1044-like [Artibeus jamaicensis]|uniref:LOW QUALITY PROTEIN: olfactory receptor 1044-like n=1 Tax=Artibeus jamaicensis TaxID=9417 RepID=UPI00235AEA82|nr:LOW QUALITY PROTEIN: olfactory receptor 1044-like [Artibeus jamaicensis]
MRNETSVTEFIPHGLLRHPELRLASSLVFLFILFSLLGNMCIIAAVTRDSRLHTPMYFFLQNLSPSWDMCYTSVTIPKALAKSLMGSNVISFWECMAQLFLFLMLGASECFLLTSMAYDRCLAIHRPLLYGIIMSRKLCVKLVAVAWLSGALYSVFHTTNTFSLPFCGPNVVDHFFCDSSPLMRLSCSDFHTHEEVGFAVGGCIFVSAFGLTMASYVVIISAIAQIRSAGGRGKAFSTCSSHLTTVTLFYVTGNIAYLSPTSQDSPIQGRLLSVFYSIITPSLNPLVYCLRNKDMQVALKKLLAPSN